MPKLINVKGLLFTSQFGTSRLVEKKVITLNFPSTSLNSNQKSVQTATTPVKAGLMAKSAVIKFSFDSVYLPAMATVSNADGDPAAAATGWSRVADISVSSNQLILNVATTNRRSNQTATVPAFSVQATVYLYAAPYTQ